MKANELRIGNLIKEFNKQIIVDSVHFRDYYDGFTQEEDWTPIKLSEKWLVKLGFEYRDYYNNYRIKAGDYYNSVQFYDNEWCYNNDSSDAGCYFVTTIKYVHELQNLYFAINNAELTHNEL